MRYKVALLIALILGILCGAFLPAAYSQGTTASLLQGQQITLSGTTTAGGIVITNAGSVNLGRTAVTQLTSNSTTVPCNGSSGIITSFGSYSTGTRAAATAFTVTDTSVVATSVITANIQGYAGVLFTNGYPQVVVGTVAAGSFTLQVVNTDATNALSGALTIAFNVL